MERELGLNSKREIEEFGLAEFAAAVPRGRRAVLRRPDAGSIRLGQWMDWGNDYFTFSDTNIEYIWRFLASSTSAAGCTRATGRPSGARAAARRSPPTSWRAATSTARPVAVRSASRCSTGRAGARHLDHHAVDAAGQRRGRRLPRRRVRAARERRLGGRRARSRRDVRRGRAGRGARRPALRGAVRRTLPGATGSSTASIGWDEVSLDEGTGVVHIAPGCGSEDFELAQATTSRCSPPVDESGRFYPDYGWLAGRRPARRRRDHRRPRASAGCSSRRGTIEHRYPECWRCHTPADLPHLRRLVHLGRRDPRADARRATRRSSGRPSTWASGWTTGSSTCPTGTSHGAATTACRCRSTRARAGTST